MTLFVDMSIWYAADEMHRLNVLVVYRNVMPTFYPSLVWYDYQNYFVYFLYFVF